MSVPKIIHQLWIGEKPAPINAMNSIKNMNPDFVYMFWNEKMIEDKLTIPPRYQRKIENHSAIWGKADMYRFLILEQFGGVFVDADMVSIEPLDDFLLNKGFFCWENEISRPNLCATSLQAYPPHHIIPRSAIDWIMNNNVYDTKTPSWELVGPGLLTRVYHSLSDKSVVNVFPSYYGLPDHHSGTKYMGHGKVYMSHEWGSTWNNYQKINDMDIPPHHKEPKQSITIDIPDSANIKSVMKAIKSMEGHFHIYINYNGNIEKYFNNMRFVSQVNTDVNNILDSNRDLTLTEIMNDFIFYDENNNIIDHYNVENIEQELCKKFIDSKDIILELGARYGTVSCVCNKIIDDKENHYVVEPDEKVWKSLEDNMKLNDCQFNIIKGIIGDKKYKLLGNGYAKTSIVDNNATGIDTFDIPDVPFNTLVADCEGFIEEFYNSHKEWFKTIHKIILECDMPHKCDYKYVIDELNSIGFKIIHNEIDSWGLRFLVLTQDCQKTPSVFS